MRADPLAPKTNCLAMCIYADVLYSLQSYSGFFIRPRPMHGGTDLGIRLFGNRGQVAGHLDSNSPTSPEHYRYGVTSYV